MKKKTVFGMILILLLLLGIGTAVLGFVLPYVQADNTMENSVGALTMRQQSDGGWLLVWGEVDNADLYRVEILDNSGDILYRNFAEDEAQILLPKLPEDRELTIQITSGARFRTLLGEDIRYSETSQAATACFAGPELSILDLSCLFCR